MQTIHATIVGGGSVGLCLAASLARTDAQVTLLVRSQHVGAVRGKPINVSGRFGEYTISPSDLAVDDAARPSEKSRDCDVLIVATKAYDVAAALRPFAGGETRRRPAVVLFQNGLGSAEIARDVMGPDTPVYSTAMMIGMVRDGPTDVRVTAHSSPVWIGALLGDDTERLASFLEVAAAGFVPMELKPEIRDTIYTKVLFNCCMNPTGALTRLTYGGLLQNPHSRALITALADEALDAFAATSGFAPAANGQRYVEDVLNAIVFPRAVEHRSSMVQDLESGRPTEVDFLNGAIVRMGETAGRKTPYHRSVVSLIHACEVA